MPILFVNALCVKTSVHLEFITSHGSRRGNIFGIVHLNWREAELFDLQTSLKVKAIGQRSRSQLLRSML